MNFFQMATAAVLSMSYLVISKEVQPAAVTSSGILSIIYLGAVSTTLTYMLQTVSQKYVDETKSAIILSLEAVFGSVFSVLILHEQFTAKMIAGCILILGAVLVSEIDLKGLCFGRRAGVEE